MANMRPPHASSAGRTARLGATRGFHHGLLIATVIGCTVALVTVVVTGLAVLRADLRELRADMREDRAEVLTEVRANRDRIDANRERIDAIVNEIRALHGVAPLALAPPTAPPPGQ